MAKVPWIKRVVSVTRVGDLWQQLLECGHVVERSGEKEPPNIFAGCDECQKLPPAEPPPVEDT